MPEVQDRFAIMPDDCEQFANMPDAELDAALVEQLRKSPVWAVISKSIRATLWTRHVELRNIKTPSEARTWIAGYISGLEYIHKIIWEAMERPPRTKEQGGPSPTDNAAVIDETQAAIAELEKEYR